MHGFDPLFLYYSRRALQEQVAAIHAASPAAAKAHERLAVLLASRAAAAGAD